MKVNCAPFVGGNFPFHIQVFFAFRILLDLMGQRKFDPSAYPGIQNLCLGEMFKSTVKEFCLGCLLLQEDCPIKTVLNDGSVAHQLVKAKLVCRMFLKNAFLYTLHPIQLLQRIRRFSKK